MYVIAFFTRRNLGMSSEEFFEHYRGTHWRLATDMPGLISYQQAELDRCAQPWALSSALADYDALSLYTFASREAAIAAFASPEGLATDADTPTFMDASAILAAPSSVIQRFDANTIIDDH